MATIAAGAPASRSTAVSLLQVLRSWAIATVVSAFLCVGLYILVFAPFAIINLFTPTSTFPSLLVFLKAMGAGVLGVLFGTAVRGSHWSLLPERLRRPLVLTWISLVGWWLIFLLLTVEGARRQAELLAVLEATRPLTGWQSAGPQPGLDLLYWGGILLFILDTLASGMVALWTARRTH